MKRLRQTVAEGLWAVATRLYPYEPAREYRHGQPFDWEATVAFSATEEEANDVFDRIQDVVCGDHHPLAECRFAFGSLHQVGGDDA